MTKSNKQAMVNANRVRDALIKSGVWCNEPREAKDDSGATWVYLETGLMDCNLNDVVFRFSLKYNGGMDNMLVTD